jgi:hypothetical protein
VLLDDLSNFFRFPDLSVGTGKYSTVGEEDPPLICPRNQRDVESDTTRTSKVYASGRYV